MINIATYIRQSLNDPASSSQDRQREIIAHFCRERNWIILREFMDLGGRRSQAEDVRKRPQFIAMMVMARARKINTILVASQDRFGSRDIYQFYGLMGELRDLNVEVWDCTAGIVINPPGYQLSGVFQAFAGTVIDTGEQRKSRAKAVVSGMSTKAKQGRYLGGGIAYGIKIKCVTHDGDEIWSCEMVGPKLYETSYIDGRVTVKNYTPCGDKADTDKIVFDRSKYLDRIMAVRYCYMRFLDGAGHCKIAGELNTLGYRLPGGRIFYSSFVQNLIENGHIYTGVSAYFKTARGKFYQCKDGVPVAVDNLHGDGSKVKKPIDSWLTSEVLLEPIITSEIYKAALELISTKSRPRSRQNRASVYAGLLLV